MILEVALSVLGAGVAVSGWVYAYRSRGESRSDLTHANEAAERARIAEAKAEAAEAKASAAVADAAAAQTELVAAHAAGEILRRTLADERKNNADLLQKLAKLGAPVGPVVMDSAIDRLHADARRRGSQGGDPNPDGDKDRPGGSVSDDAPRPTDDKTRPR